VARLALTMAVLPLPFARLEQEWPANLLHLLLVAAMNVSVFP